VDQAHRGALKGWDHAARIAADGNYATPLLRAVSDAGLAAYQAIDGDLQCLMNASEAAANFAAPANTPEWDAAKEAEQKAQVAIIRDIFKDPFQK
jgi:hypothetical protein